MSSRIFLIICAASALISVGCRDDGTKQLDQNSPDIAKVLFIGADIYEAKTSLEEIGFEVGEISDITGTGDQLSMLVTLEEFDPNFLDTIGYASDPQVDLQPWKSGEINYLSVKSDNSGKVTRITSK